MIFVSFIANWIRFWLNLFYSIITYPFDLVLGRKRVVVSERKTTVIKQTSQPTTITTTNNSKSNNNTVMAKQQSQGPQEEKLEKIQEQYRQTELQKSVLLTQLDNLREQVQGIRSQLDESKRQKVFYEEKYHEAERDRKKLFQELDSVRSTAVSPYLSSTRSYFQSSSGRTHEEEQQWQEEENKAMNTMNTLLQIDLIVTSVYLSFSLLFFHQDSELLPKKTSYLMYTSMVMSAGLCYLYYYCIRREPKQQTIPIIAKQLVVKTTCVIAFGQLLLLFFYSEVFTPKELMLTFTVWEWLAGSGVYWGFFYQPHNICSTGSSSSPSLHKTSSSHHPAGSDEKQHLYSQSPAGFHPSSSSSSAAYMRKNS